MTGPVIYLLDRRDVEHSALAAAEQQLSPEDRARHAAFRRPERQEQFVLGRALLRRAAARAMHCEPGSLDITSHSDGRAWVTAPPGFVPKFSLSHSGDWIACAVHPSVAIGLDVECMRATRDLSGIGALTFGADEHSWLLSQPSLTSAFYRLWTGREALIKLAAELGSPAGATGALVVDGSLIEAPAPAAGWHHTEVRPRVALSLVWEGDSGPVRVEFIRDLRTAA